MRVEIWSDIVCPWCYLGKRRFETALGRFAHRDRVDVVWRSFELQPDSPAVSPGRHVEYLAAKFGNSPADAQQMLDRITALAAAEGLEYRFDKVQTSNTFAAHRLLHLAAELGVQAEVKERLMRAYFTEGAAIGDPDTLVRLAGETGVDEGLARATLDGDRFADAVRADERKARALGITGVPFFVLDRRYGVSGAQSAETILATLERAWGDAHPEAEPAPAAEPAAADAADACAP